MKRRRLSLAGALLLLLPAVIIHYLSASPSVGFNVGNKAALVVSLKKTTAPEHVCDEEEKRAFLEKSEKRLKHMRRPGAECGSRNRVPLGVRIWLDGNMIEDREVEPNGIRRDMPVYLYRKYSVPAGAHKIKIDMRDSLKSKDEFDYHFAAEKTFSPGGVIIIRFDEEKKTFVPL